MQGKDKLTMYKSKDFVIWTVSDTPELACHNWTAVYRAKYKKIAKYKKPTKAVKKGGDDIIDMKFKTNTEKRKYKI